MVTFGSGIGLFTCLQTLLEQIIRPQGYSDVSINEAVKHIPSYFFIFHHALCSSIIMDPHHGRKLLLIVVIKKLEDKLED